MTKRQYVEKIQNLWKWFLSFWNAHVIFIYIKVAEIQQQSSTSRHSSAIVEGGYSSDDENDDGQSEEEREKEVSAEERAYEQASLMLNELLWKSES